MFFNFQIHSNNVFAMCPMRKSLQIFVDGGRSLY